MCVSELPIGVPDSVDSSDWLGAAVGVVVPSFTWGAVDCGLLIEVDGGSETV